MRGVDAMGGTIQQSEGGFVPSDLLLRSVCVALSIGIVGLPNVGKSTLFTALTRNQVDAANYPFATIKAHVTADGDIVHFKLNV